MTEYDVLIKDGLIVDGNGKTAFKGSLAVKGNRIGAVGEPKKPLRDSQQSDKKDGK